MALYLGNQKVSLRSGQDPTFDYGFDSNGRLVFANKNATEINNFLNYDSSYSEILDLSNLNKMEKVAVNGTADRKMEGLKGLLVSQNAPFTGTSPQINASYTGLNKSALVSLFESAPYNVGYKKVGNPTIVDGVVSGFSGYPDSAAIIKTSQQLDTSLPFEINVEFKRNSTAPGCVVSTKGGELCQPQGNNIIRIKLRNYANTDTIYASYDATLINWENNATYIFNLVYSNNSYIYTIKRKSDNALVYTKTISSEEKMSLGTFYFGGTLNEAYVPLDGSIDLNNTYIKVNGVNWFGPGATKNLVPDGTVVGDVIVKDGIASGFSDSNYLLINDTPFSSSNDVEMIIRFTPTEIESGYLFGFGTSAGIYLTKISDKLRYGIAYNGITQTTAGSSYAIDALNIPYYLHFLFYHSNLNVKMGLSADGLNPTYGIDVTASAAPSITSLLLGKTRVASNYYLRGSIDLNNTYIKVGSNYFYRGMVPMTKTCSIVGATGTADLTQEDKNIILNKGWSLTVQ